MREKKEPAQTLVVFNEINPAEILDATDLQPFLTLIDKEVKSLVFEIETESGRQDLKDFGKKIRASEKVVEDASFIKAGKLKEVSNAYDAKRREFGKHMKALKIEVLKPLVEYEAAETAKTEAIESLIESLKIADAAGHQVLQAASLDTLNTWVSEAKELLFSADFGDQFDRARGVLDDSLLKADGLIARFEKFEREETASEIKRIAEAQEAQEAHDAELIKYAKENEARAIQDAKDAKIKAKQDAEAATKLAEVMAKEAAERVEQAAKDGALKAIKVERDRLINEGIAAKAKLDKENAAIDKMKSAQKHRHTIHVACKASLIAVVGLDNETASKVVKALSENVIEHAEIRY